jgi:hypothetical protein
VPVLGPTKPPVKFAAGQAGEKTLLEEDEDEDEDEEEEEVVVISGMDDVVTSGMGASVVVSMTMGGSEVGSSTMGASEVVSSTTGGGASVVVAGWAYGQSVKVGLQTVRVMVWVVVEVRVVVCSGSWAATMEAAPAARMV